MKFNPRDVQDLGINPVDENSRIPLYRQVHMDLLNLLQSGKLVKGDMLPTESVLSEAYGVGRQTLREAVTRLVNEGLLERTAGRGTVVMGGKNQIKIFLDRSFAQQIAEMGLKPRSEVLRKTKRTIDEVSPITLHTKKGSQSLELIRLRFGDDIPLGVQYTTIITDLCPDLGDYEFIEESLYSLLLTKYKLPITRIDQVVSAVLADDWHKSLLKISEPVSLLQVNTTAYLDNGEPIEASTSFYVGDRYDYTITQGF